MRLRLWLAGIVALALLARLAAVAWLGQFGPGYEQEYEIVARLLAEAGYFGIDLNSVYGETDARVTAFVPPLYPALLALLRLAFGPAGDGLAARLLQALLSTLSVALLYPLGLAVFRRPAVALTGALLAAVFPPLVGAVVETTPVTLEVLLLQLFVLLALPPGLLPGARGPGWGRFALAGVVLGLAALTRPPALLLLGWLPLALAANRAPRQPSVAGPVLAACLAAALTIAPWTLRNWRVLGEPILISSNGGINFWIGNNPQATGEFIWPPAAAPELLAASASLSEGARDRFFYAEGLDFIRRQPLDFLRLAGTKLVYFLWTRPTLGGTYEGQAAVGLGRLAYQAAAAFLLPLWLAGLALTRRNWRPQMVLYGPILAILAANVIYFVGTRFRTPAAPYQLLFAAAALVSLAAALRSRWPRWAALPAAGETPQ